MNKLALLVGIGKYQSKQWAELPNSSENVRIMKDILERFNFPPKNIEVLTSESEPKPTAANIVSFFNKHLIGQAQPGDIAVFYYFGHGTQVPSMDNDETDGCDEALVPYDADFDREAYKPWVNYLLDDDLYYLIQQLVNKGVKVTAIMESCHSGTSVRTIGFPLKPRPRGGGDTAPIPVPPFIQDATRVHRSEKVTSSKWLPEGNYVLLAACADKQLNFMYTPPDTKQDKMIGRLTWCLDQELRLAKSENFTYRQLHERIRRRYNEITEGFAQDPQLEGIGDSRDWSVFGGDPQPIARYILVSQSTPSGDKIELAAGSAHGLTKGSQLAIYPNRIVKENKVTTNDLLAMAEIEKVEVCSSIAKLDKPVPEERRADLTDAHAFLQSYGFSEFRMPVALAIDLPNREEIDAILRNSSLLSVVDESQSVEAEISYSNKEAAFLLTLRDGEALLPNAIDDGKPDPAAICRILEHIARRRNLLDKLEMVKPPDSLLQGKVRLCLRRLDQAYKVIEELGQEPELRPGDYIQVDVINETKYDLYCNVFGCSPMPYWEIKPLFPVAQGAMDNRLKGQDTHTIGQFEVSHVIGKTVLKLIATMNFSDLSSWTQQRLPDGEVVRLRALDNKMPQFLASLWHGAKVGIRLARGEDWTTDSVAFSVIQE